MADYLTGLGTTEIWRTDHNWKNNPGFSFESALKVLKFTGTIQQFKILSEEKPLRFKQSLTNFDKIQEFTLLEQFTALQGRLNRFWILSTLNSFSLKGSFASGLSQIKTYDNYHEYRGFERIYFLMSSGDLLTFEATDMVRDELNNEITIDLGANLDRDLNPEDIDIFGLVVLCRLEKDSLAIIHNTAGVSEASIEIIELVKEYTEA